MQRAFKIILGWLVIFLIFNFGHFNAGARENYVSDQIIVKFKPVSAEKSFKSMNIPSDTSVLDTDYQTGYQLLKISSDKSPADVISALMQSDLVESAEVNHIYRATFLPNDPYFSDQWGLKSINTEQAWDLAEGKSSVLVAVLDTGINANHSDLKGVILTGKSLFNDLTPQDTVDNNGHGTHVAGIIGAVTGNETGVAGIASGVRILPVKVLDDNGEGSDWTVAEGINYAVASGAKVINLSLGSCYGSSILQTAVKNAVEKGVLLVAAAGNEGMAHVDYPAAYPEVVAVSALDATGTLASFSNFGPKLWVSAPGVGIISTYAGPDADKESPYAYLSGTSMAAPLVSGLAALVLSADPTLTASELKDILRNSTDDLGDLGKDNKFGYGRINAYKAIDYVMEITEPISVESGIKGKVLVEGKNNHSGVQVKVIGIEPDMSTITSSDGSFQLNSIPLGSHELLICLPSYLKEKINVNVTGDGYIVIPDICLKAGDFNNSNNIDLFDLIIFSRAYQSNNNDPAWNPCTDIVPDGLIDLSDLCWVAKNYGKWGGNN